MSHSIHPAQYHPRYHSPEPHAQHVASIDAKDKAEQAVRFLVAQGIDAKEAAEIVASEGAEEVLAQRDHMPEPDSEPKAEPEPDSDDAA